MCNYRISKIYMENFKLFNKVLVDFNEANLIVLDGPNGFGKTSIFDAIELILTGQISRISNNTIDHRDGYKDILISKDAKLDIIIMIEFKSTENSFTIAKKISYTSVNKDKDRNPNNLGSLFKTYKSNEFSPENFKFLPDNEICQKDINTLFKEDMKTFYSLYYYIEQEDRSATRSRIVNC